VGLLEREHECARLGEIVRDVSAGAGALAVDEGPPGIGKSALLDWLGGECCTAGIPARTARATELGAGVAFGLARRLLEGDVRRHPTLLNEGWARRARPVFDGDAAGSGLAAPLTEGLLALVAELVRAHGPLLLAVDDAQWADASSLSFLGELAERRHELGAGLVVAVSDGAPGTDRAALDRLASLAGDPWIITPAPLSPGAIRALTDARLPGADERLPERLADATGGNPLLVVALLEAAERDDLDHLRVPAAVTRLVPARLRDLGAEAGELALAVAVLGEAPLRLAAELAAVPPAAAEAAADALTARHVLAEGEPLRFSQPIVAEALLQTIAGFDLSGRHRRAAEILAGDGADAEDIATHLLRSRPDGQAWICDVLRRAARAALDRGDPAGAVDLLERAAGEPPPPEARGDLLVELARARAAAGSPTAIKAFERALGHVRDPAQRAVAWHGLSRLLYVRGAHALAAAAAAGGLSELPPGDERRERLLADELAAALFVPDRAPEAMARTEALIKAPPPSDPSLLAQLIVHQSWRGIDIHRLPDMAAAAVAADPLVDPESGGFGLSFVAGALNMIDQTPRSLRLLDVGLARVAERGDPLAEVALRCCWAWAHIHQGRLARAGEDLAAVQALNRLGWPVVDGLCGPPLVRLLVERGDLEGAREAFRGTPAGIHNPGLPWFAGIIAFAAGDYAAALTEFEAAGEELEGRLGLGNPGVLPWRSSAALAALQLGRTGYAAELAQRELHQADGLGVPRALGIALRVAGFIADDLALLERSVTVLERSPAELELAYSQLMLGIGYRRARRSRDARAPLGRALDAARELGAAVLAERAAQELRAAGARPRRRPRTGLRALTPSERNVAELAGAGKTNRQIAGELFLTPKTVETHLTRIFRKLGVTSRAQIAPLLTPDEDAVSDGPAPAPPASPDGRSPSERCMMSIATSSSGDSSPSRLSRIASHMASGSWPAAWASAARLAKPSSSDRVRRSIRPSV
jgi:DNA-binding CsgD family transcriptional regulator